MGKHLVLIQVLYTTCDHSYHSYHSTMSPKELFKLDFFHQHNGDLIFWNGTEPVLLEEMLRAWFDCSQTKS